MGYMGFGMQKWIYGMRPRKPFSMEHKKSFTSVPNVVSRKFKLQPSKQSGKFYIIISFLLLFLFFTINLIYKVRFLSYSNTLMKQKNERIIKINNEAFIFLMNSGKNRLKNNNIIGAYSEFKMAYNLKPQNTELQTLLFEATNILCQYDGKYCDELDKFKINFSIK